MVTQSDQLVPVGMLGAFVSPLVQTYQTGKVMGITSRGIFLLFDHRVFFLTAENHENPFMIHIPHLADLPRHVLLNQEVHLEEGILRVGEKHYDLRALPRLVPDPLPISSVQPGSPKAVAQIDTLFHLLNQPNHQDSLIHIVDALLNHVEPQEPERQNILKAVLQLRGGMQEKNLDECETAMMTLAGNGKGLTPAGDDLLCGFLLILNTLEPSTNVDPGFISRLNASAIGLVQKRSTWISANMIEAAARRLVDERVGRTARLLLGTWQMDTAAIANSLETFGSSSGIDAFTGMTAALLP